MSSPERYRTIRATSQAEITVSRSRFLCQVTRVDGESEARAVINNVRAENWDARHHCTAFVIGADASIVNSNDDGEPSGTAGRPILEVLKGAGISDVVAVVTRWFGGTLLGTGGLARAYAHSTKEALLEAEVVERSLQHVCEIAVGMAEVGRVEHTLRSRGAHVLGTDYADRATLMVAVPSVELAGVAGTVAELTDGTGAVDQLGTRWVDVE